MINNHYHHLAFGPAAIERQRANGSYVAYGTHLERPDDGPDQLGSRELRMIADATQFYLGTVTPTGWPYLQYRSGPAGFVRHLGGNTVRFIDLPGNNQFVTLGNLTADDRLAMFFVDYPRKQRLKVFGRGSVREGERREIDVTVEAFDWNCSRSIIPRYDQQYLTDLGKAYQDKAAAKEAELTAEIERLHARIDQLEQRGGASAP